jgi:hypothetical protein
VLPTRSNRRSGNNKNRHGNQPGEKDFVWRHVVESSAIISVVGSETDGGVVGMMLVQPPRPAGRRFDNKVDWSNLWSVALGGACEHTAWAIFQSETLLIKMKEQRTPHCSNACGIARDRMLL